MPLVNPFTGSIRPLELVLASGSSINFNFRFFKMDRSLNGFNMGMKKHK